jgi:hypothetical protein
MRQQKKRASGLSPPGQALAAIQEVSAKTAQLHCSIRGWATQPLALLAQSPILTVVKARLRRLFIIGEKCGLGIARRALDEITTQAIEKGRGFPPSPLPAQPHFQYALGKAETELASVRALALQLLSELYVEAEAGGTPPPTRQAQARAACAYITEIAQHVTTVAFQAAGGGALFEANPLQRCLRDVLATGQHFVVSHSSYQALGQFKLDQSDANPML